MSEFLMSKVRQLPPELAKARSDTAAELRRLHTRIERHDRAVMRLHRIREDLLGARDKATRDMMSVESQIAGTPVSIFERLVRHAKHNRNDETLTVCETGEEMGFMSTRGKAARTVRRVDMRGPHGSWHLKYHDDSIRVTPVEPGRWKDRMGRIWLTDEGSAGGATTS